MRVHYDPDGKPFVVRWARGRPPTLQQFRLRGAVTGARGDVRAALLRAERATGWRAWRLPCR